MSLCLRYFTARLLPPHEYVMRARKIDSVQFSPPPPPCFARQQNSLAFGPSAMHVIKAAAV